jgi:hypothetical protein
MCALRLVTGWTKLSRPPKGLHIGNLWHLCVGCLNPLNESRPIITCRFCDTGFLAGSTRCRPCQARFHPACVRIGTSFSTRLDKSGGLILPQDPVAYRHYICEAFVVCSILEWELTLTARDTATFMLERARFIDLAKHWATGTLKTYHSKFNILSSFSQDFRIPFCGPTTVLDRPPPFGEAVKMMWAQERNSLYPSDWHRAQPNCEKSVFFGYVCPIRSAASLYWMCV